jgi:hypothetical protein
METRNIVTSRGQKFEAGKIYKAKDGDLLVYTGSTYCKNMRRLFVFKDVVNGKEWHLVRCGMRTLIPV